MKNLMLLVLGCLCLFARPSSVQAQTRSTEPATETRPQSPPRLVLYRHLLAHVEHLAKRAEELTQQGGNASGLTDYYQKQVPLSPAEANILAAAAALFQQDIGAHDERAQKVIKAFRERYKGERFSAANPIPPPPPELKDLQRERDTLIARHVDSLQHALRPAAAARLESFLFRDFAPNVRLQLVGVPRPHNPSVSAPPAFSGGK